MNALITFRCKPTDTNHQQKCDVIVSVSKLNGTVKSFCNNKEIYNKLDAYFGVGKWVCRNTTINDDGSNELNVTDNVDVSVIVQLKLYGSGLTVQEPRTIICDLPVYSNIAVIPDISAIIKDANDKYSTASQTYDVVGITLTIAKHKGGV